MGSGVNAETADSPALSRSKALHEAVARYRVTVSRMVPRKRTDEIATDLTYRDAKSMREALTRQLAEEEPQWANCMCRSLALIELTNGPEVARILGYGPNFTYEAAEQSVAEFLKGLGRNQVLDAEKAP
jgi:hypothetical protein